MTNALSLRCYKRSQASAQRLASALTSQTFNALDHSWTLHSHAPTIYVEPKPALFLKIGNDNGILRFSPLSIETTAATICNLAPGLLPFDLAQAVVASLTEQILLQLCPQTKDATLSVTVGSDFADTDMPIALGWTLDHVTKGKVASGELRITDKTSKNWANQIPATHKNHHLDQWTNLPVTCRLELGSALISMEECMTLQPGDVLLADVPLSPSQVSINFDNGLTARAKLENATLTLETDLHHVAEK